MTTAAEKAAFEFRPPMNTGLNKVTKIAATNSAAETYIFSHLSSSAEPTDRQHVQLTLKASGGKVHVFFKLGSSSASVNTSTGFPLADGDERSWWVCGGEQDYIEHITASGNVDLFMYVSSPKY